MHEVLNLDLFFFEEQAGLLKAGNRYDVYNPRTQEKVMVCREENLSLGAKLARLNFLKSSTSFKLIVRDQADVKLLVVTRPKGAKSQHDPIEVLDENDQLVGKIQPKVNLKGDFDVFDPQGALQYTILKNEEKDFNFVKEGQNLAKISKKWAGAGKEFFTTADNYLLQIMVTVPENDPLRLVILASVLVIDMVLYE